MHAAYSLSKLGTAKSLRSNLGCAILAPVRTFASRWQKWLECLREGRLEGGGLTVLQRQHGEFDAGVDVPT